LLKSDHKKGDGDMARRGAELTEGIQYFFQRSQRL